MSIFLAIVALGLLIIVHEGGHYIVARWSKMRVERFSLGFGPPVVSWKRGETNFQIAPIPLGGFVQITGMNPHEEYDEKDPRVYPNRPTWQRFATIFAGPFTNLLFSIVLVWIVFAVEGMETAWYTVGRVLPAGANDGVKVAGWGVLAPDDRILAVDGEPIYFTRSGLRDHLQRTRDRAVAITVLRDGAERTVWVTPVKDAKSGDFRLGIELGIHLERKKVGLGTATVEAFKYPWLKSAELIGGLRDIVTRKAPADATGPVGIVNMINRSVQAGWVRTLEFLAFLNVALGIFNLLPIPALDGGRLVFLSYELVTRRRPNPRIEAAVHMVGFALLALLFLVVTWKDIRNLFT